MKVNKNLLTNAQPYDPFEDLPPSAEQQCQLAADLAIAIYQYRAKNHLTQAAFGKLLGMTQSQVSKLENGDVNLTIERMSHILELLQYQIQLQPIAKPCYYQEIVSNFDAWFSVGSSPLPFHMISAFA